MTRARRMVVWLLGVILQVAAGCALAGPGNFSVAAQSACSDVPNASGYAQISSPNGLRTVREVLDGEGTPSFFLDDEGGRTRRIDTGDWPCPEVGWSADSNFVFVTYSTGGGVGTYSISIYRTSGGAIVPIELTHEVRRDAAAHYPKCFDPEAPNIAGVGWSADSRTLLVAAQVLPHSNCDSMGTFTLYEVATASGKILHRYSQLEAKKRYGAMLGAELRNADDSCFSRPDACWIPQLHPPTAAGRRAHVH